MPLADLCQRGRRGPLVRSGALVAVPLAETGVFPIHVVQPGSRYTPAKQRLFVADIAEALRRRFPDGAPS
jgi:hypothetical protein